MTFLLRLKIFAVIFSPGTFSPVSKWQQVDQQITLFNWVKQQNQLFASGQLLTAPEHDEGFGMMESGDNDNNGTSSTPALSLWQQAYLAQLQLLATMAAQHQQFISGQTSTEQNKEEEDDNDLDLTELESEVQNEEMEIMEIQDAEEENEESIPDEDSTESALTYH